mmetsp:Transcript_131443/g.227617  ORF Transcript_131443/g.227617 Transcript_131443/m.227617 type:complete len:320 (-) Transcript_131443:284-1243(-)
MPSPFPVAQFRRSTICFSPPVLQTSFAALLCLAPVPYPSVRCISNSDRVSPSLHLDSWLPFSGVTPPQFPCTSFQHGAHSPSFPAFPASFVQSFHATDALLPFACSQHNPFARLSIASTRMPIVLHASSGPSYRAAPAPAPFVYLRCRSVCSLLSVIHGSFVEAALRSFAAAAAALPLPPSACSWRGSILPQSTPHPAPTPAGLAFHSVPPGQWGASPLPSSYASIFLVPPPSPSALFRRAAFSGLSPAPQGSSAPSFHATLSLPPPAWSRPGALFHTSSLFRCSSAPALPAAPSLPLFAYAGQEAISCLHHARSRRSF